ncbi:MAG: hypothetical protein P8179_13225 [Candidatus Thiodiazotropha sp.]|jgi:hypothetical protein
MEGITREELEKVIKFICETDDDPIVFGVMDGDAPLKQIADSFTQYIKRAAGVDI